MRAVVGAACMLVSLGAWAAEIAALVAGESRAFTLPTVPGTAYVLVVEEQGIDCDATVTLGERRQNGFDGDALRFGRHRFAFLARDASVRVDIAATRRGSPPGNIAVDLHAVDLGDERASGLFALDLLETETTNRYRDSQRARTDETVSIARQLLQGRATIADDAGFVRASLLLDRILAGAGRRPEAIEVLTKALPAMDRTGDRRSSAGAYNNIGMHRFRLGDGRLAQAPLRRALDLARGLGDGLLEAVVQNNLCLTTASRGHMNDSIRCYRRAMTLSLASGDSLRIATAYNNLGNALSLADRHDEASVEFERAIALRIAIADAKGLGDPLGNLGLERQAQARYDEADVLFRRAESVSRAADDRDGLSTALRHRGQLRLLLGDTAGAVELLTECVTLDRASGRRRDLIAALTRLGDARSLAEPGTIPPALVEAIALAQIDAEPRTLADALLRFARAANRAGHAGEGADAAIRAVSIVRSIGDGRLEGLAVLEEARATLQEGNLPRALERARFAARKLSAASDRLGAAEAAGVAGVVEVRSGKLEQGIATLAGATAALEKARDSLAAPESRARFFAVRRSMHEAHVLALLDLARARADPALVETALAVSDAHRSRVLLDRLAQGRAPGGGHEMPDWPADVALLHFLVTPQTSVAFVKRGGTVREVRLPGLAALEAGVASFRRSIFEGGGDTDICAALWKPLAELDLPERLVIVPDGPLSGLPWAALPCADPAGARLIDRYEFSTLPSVAVWRAANTSARAKDAEGAIDTLVLADPVYRADDPRFGSVEAMPAPAIRAVLRGRDMLRLPGTLAEARLISRLHGNEGLEVLTGFDVTRDAVSSRLQRVRSMLHFGTHGAAGTSSLGESGLLLSQFDRQGRAIDGFLSASEIAKQRVDVDLVVLAACDSAGGVVVSGEAALGVSYAFTMAGARQVIGATWPVSDTAASVLMEAFYTAYYRDGLVASAALRRAQRTLRSSVHFSDPRYWAAFQLSGGAGGASLSMVKTPR